MNIKFWKYWTVLILIGFALVTGQIYFGLFDFILAYDQTYLSIVNIAILIAAHIMIGQKHLKKRYITDTNDMIRFMGDSAVAIGLTGTLIGFMMVLWSVFGPGVVIDPGNIASMTTAMTNMAQGMSAALITSLTGIITSTLISLQLVILEE